MHSQTVGNRFNSTHSLSVRDIAQAAALNLYAHHCRRPLLTQIKSLFSKQASRLQQFDGVSANAVKAEAVIVKEIELSQIRGTVGGRSEDFDDAFRPLNTHTESRWISIATARKLGKQLPPVQLMQVGDSYFVEDGHHRISVASAFGDDAILAQVTVCS